MPVEKKASALQVMAARYSLEPDKLFATLKATVFKGASNEELVALVVVSNEYKLNPFLKQIYAFPDKRGGIVPVVSVDGWLRIVNDQDALDGVEFEWEWDDKGKPVSCTGIIWVKGRSKPVRIPEYFEECQRNTDPWRQMPRRMLRHKALIQAARVAFGLGGVFDEDEAADIARSQKTPNAVAPVFDVPIETTRIEEVSSASQAEPERAKRTRKTSDKPAEPEPAATTQAANSDASDDVPMDGPTPLQQRESLAAMLTASGFSEAQVMEVLVRRYKAPLVKSIAELTDEYVGEVIRQWDLVVQQLKFDRNAA